MLVINKIKVIKLITKTTNLIYIDTLFKFGIINIYI